MKLIILVLIIYTIYLNMLQTSTLKNVNVKDNSPIIKSQLNINIIYEKDEQKKITKKII
jgi:hypothetical protein